MRCRGSPCECENTKSFFSFVIQLFCVCLKGPEAYSTYIYLLRESIAAKASCTVLLTSILIMRWLAIRSRFLIDLTRMYMCTQCVR